MSSGRSDSEVRSGGEKSGVCLKSYGCCNELPQVRGLKTTQMYFRTVLEAKSPKSASRSRAGSFWRLQGRVHFLSSFQMSSSEPAVGCLHISSCPLALSLYNLPTLTPPVSSYKDRCNYTRPTQIFQDNLPISKPLTGSHLPYKVTFTGSRS